MTTLNTLAFARDLARFESHLEWAAQQTGSYDYDGTLRAFARSYQALLGQLADSQDPAAAIAEAIRVYDQDMTAFVAARRKADARRQAEYAEAVRRHQVAVTVECPYCNSAPGAVCRTAGPSGKSFPKGVADHRDRYRTAAHAVNGAAP